MERLNTTRRRIIANPKPWYESSTVWFALFFAFGWLMYAIFDGGSNGYTTATEFAVVALARMRSADLIGPLELRRARKHKRK